MSDLPGATPPLAQDAPQQTTASSRPSSDKAHAEPAAPSRSVQMETLPSANVVVTTVQPSVGAPKLPSVDVSTSPDAPSSRATQAPAESIAPSAPSQQGPPAEQLIRADTEAIGPSTDTPAVKPDTSSGPVVIITLLLTTGARHPYKIDEKYLKKRNVNVEDMDPYNISVYTLKELIWRDWREEWETRPTSPSAIRLIHFGRMLDDKSPLKECRFQTEAPNVVHMTVKPQEVVDDEEHAKTGKGTSRRENDEETHAGCRCVIL